MAGDAFFFLYSIAAINTITAVRQTHPTLDRPKRHYVSLIQCREDIHQHVQDIKVHEAYEIVGAIAEEHAVTVASQTRQHENINESTGDMVTQRCTSLSPYSVYSPHNRSVRAELSPTVATFVRAT